MKPMITFEHDKQTYTLTQPGGKAAAPGAGAVTFTEFTLSAKKLRTDDPLTMQVELEGEKIAHVLLEVYMMVEGQRMGPLTQSYCLAPENKTVNGVSYPVWGEKISLTASVALFFPVLISGKARTLGAACVEKYTLAAHESTYRINGLLVINQGRSQYKARACFDAEGKFLSMTAVKEQHGRGFSRGITLKSGDTFQPLIKGYSDLNQDEGADYAADAVEAQASMQRSLLPAKAGSYAVGVRVQDLDGNSVVKFETVEVSAA
jgi:hypothetical protein